MKKQIGIIVSLCILLIACNSKVEKKKDNKYYSMLVNKDWAMLQGKMPWVKDLKISDSFFNFKSFSFYIDSVKKNWTSIANAYKKTQSLSDSFTLDFGYILRIFNFDTSGTVKYSIKRNNMHFVDDYFTLEQGTWVLKMDTLILNLKGDEYDGKFHYKMSYHLSFQDSNSLKLQLLKVLESDFTKNVF